MIKLLFVLLTLAACAGTDGYSYEELGTDEQAFSTRTSAVGGRTWGVTSSEAACTNVAGQTCRFIATSTNASADMLYKVYIKTTPADTCSAGFCGSDYTLVKNAVDNWVAAMQTSVSGSAAPFSFSRVSSQASANIVVQRDARSGQETALYSRYVDLAFGGCLGLLADNSSGITVQSSFQRCTDATVYFDLDDLTHYTLQQGYAAYNATQVKHEAIMHVLQAAFGWGEQSNFNNVVTYHSMSKTSTKFFSNNEQNCRAKNFSDLTGLGNSRFGIIANTCAN